MGFLENLFSKKQEIPHNESEGSPFIEPEIMKGRIDGVEIDYFTVEDNFGNPTLVLKHVYSDEPGILFNIIGRGPVEEF